jgi:hypothetical protein
MQGTWVMVSSVRRGRGRLIRISVVVLLHLRDFSLNTDLHLS